MVLEAMKEQCVRVECSVRIYVRYSPSLSLYSLYYKLPPIKIFGKKIKIRVLVPILVMFALT